MVKEILHMKVVLNSYAEYYENYPAISSINLKRIIREVSSL